MGHVSWGLFLSAKYLVSKEDSLAFGVYQVPMKVFCFPQNLIAPGAGCAVQPSLQKGHVFPAARRKMLAELPLLGPDMKDHLSEVWDGGRDWGPGKGRKQPLLFTFGLHPILSFQAQGGRS